MNRRQYKKKSRLNLLKEVYKLDCTNKDFIIMKYPYGEISYSELSNWFEFIIKNIKQKKVIALPDVLTLESCSNDEILEWIELANNMIKN